MKTVKSVSVKMFGAALLVMWFAAAFAGASDSDLAVSGGLFGGEIDGERVWSGDAAVTLPLSGPFEAHAEMLLNEIGDDDSQSFGGHLYWRDPDVGLIGLVALHTEFDFFGLRGNLDGYGVEGELYFSGLAVAAQYARLRSDDAFLDDEEYVAADIHWDSGGSFYLYGGLRSVAGEDIGYGEVSFTPAGGWSPLTLYGGVTWSDFESQYLGIEFVAYSSDRSSVALFVEVDTGADGYDAVFLGLACATGPVEKGPLISLFQQVSGGF